MDEESDKKVLRFNEIYNNKELKNKSSKLIVEPILKN
jgi:hypothetical protein